MNRVLICFIILLCLSCNGFTNELDKGRKVPAEISRLYSNAEEHIECVSSRWALSAAVNSQKCLFYDTQTIEKKNKYNPFEDKIIKLWLKEHWFDHAVVPKYYVYEGCRNYAREDKERIMKKNHNIPVFVEINIDKRLIRILEPVPKNAFVPSPNSFEEDWILVAKWIYDEFDN